MAMSGPDTLLSPPVIGGVKANRRRSVEVLRLQLGAALTAESPRTAPPTPLNKVRKGACPLPDHTPQRPRGWEY
jgi:hypothetical protein